MKFISCVLPMLALAFAVPIDADAQSLPRQHLLFNENWRIHLGDTIDAKPLGAGYNITGCHWKAGKNPPI